MSAERPFAVFDIDGVLADVRHRLPYVENRPPDWDAFFAAAPLDDLLPEGLQATLVAAKDHELIYLTGRPERCRDETQGWLVGHGLPPGRLLMRGDTDRRPARITKLEQLRRLRRQGAVAVLVDDDARVIKAARDEGFNVMHATWMEQVTSPVGQDALFSAQETEGRT